MPDTRDVIILGAGSAGLAALREVRKHTENFLIVNAGPYGTTCARVGCMPSKALIEAAKAFHARHRYPAFGIRGGEALTIDIPAVLEHVRDLRDRFVASTLAATRSLGERSISGRARLLAPDRVDIDGRVVTARRIIIATGSHPVMPEAWASLDERLLTSDTLFEQKTLPARMGVVGLGALGVELAQALARLGIHVTAFGRGHRLAGLTDDPVNAALRGSLEKEFSIHTGAEVQLTAAGNGVMMRAGGTEVTVDRVLVAVGRRANLDDLGLETLGVPLDERGMPPFNPESTQVADLPVFIAGDAGNGTMLLYEAADEGHIAGRNVLSDSPDCFQRRTPIGIVFSEPGVALVGKRHADLDPGQTLVGESRFDNQGRARTAQRNQGLMRIYASRKEGRLLGAEMCVPAAEHMAHLLALAIGQKLRVADLLRMPFYHPVLEEGLRTALRTLAAHFDIGASDLASCDAFESEALD